MILLVAVLCAATQVRRLCLQCLILHGLRPCILREVISARVPRHSKRLCWIKQPENDNVVNNVYNLSNKDVDDSENRYFHRCPELARAIEEKLKKKQASSGTS